jgi:hypothetical protein
VGVRVGVNVDVCVGVGVGVVITGHDVAFAITWNDAVDEVLLYVRL